MNTIINFRTNLTARNTVVLALLSSLGLSIQISQPSFAQFSTSGGRIVYTTAPSAPGATSTHTTPSAPSSTHYGVPTTNPVVPASRPVLPVQVQAQLQSIVPIAPQSHLMVPVQIQAKQQVVDPNAVSPSVNSLIPTTMEVNLKGGSARKRKSAVEPASFNWQLRYKDGSTQTQQYTQSSGKLILSNSATALAKKGGPIIPEPTNWVSKNSLTATAPVNGGPIMPEPLNPVSKSDSNATAPANGGPIMPEPLNPVSKGGSTIYVPASSRGLDDGNNNIDMTLTGAKPGPTCGPDKKNAEDDQNDTVPTEMTGLQLTGAKPGPTCGPDKKKDDQKDNAKSPTGSHLNGGPTLVGEPSQQKASIFDHLLNSPADLQLLADRDAAAAALKNELQNFMNAQGWGKETASWYTVVPNGTGNFDLTSNIADGVIMYWMAGSEYDQSDAHSAQTSLQNALAKDPKELSKLKELGQKLKDVQQRLDKVTIEEMQKSWSDVLRGGLD